MMKLICALLLSGLIFPGRLPASPEMSPRRLTDTSIIDVLEAHNVSRGSNILSASVSEARELIFYASEPPRFFERKVIVSNSGDAFKRYKADGRGARERHAVFDGQDAYEAVVEEGRQVGAIDRLTGTELAAVEFRVRTFGLIPFLKELSNPEVEVTHIERTARMEDKFEVKNSAGSWTFYADQAHMICRVEVGDKVLEFADFRLVQGVWLPFVQRLARGGHLKYEVFFTAIQLDPPLRPDHFSPAALAEEIAR